MERLAVVSCPVCLRRYWIDTETDETTAQCGGCRAKFDLLIPRLPDIVEDALILNDEIQVIETSFGEALERLLRYSCVWMIQQGNEITPRTLLDFIERATSDHVCDQVRERDWSQYRASECEELDYMVYRLAAQPSYARRNLRLAIAGMIHGIDWANFSPKPSMKSAATQGMPRPSGSC